MNQYDYADALAAELEHWANLDGCEGGDFLTALARAINTAHYSYVDDEEIPKKLFQIAIEEIEQHWTYQVYYGESHQDPEYVQQELNFIQTIWRPDWTPPNVIEEAKV